MIRVDVRPELLRWARERAGISTAALRKRFSRFEEWETGASKPTLKQLEKYAHALWVPIGYLFLDTPPSEQVPIPDFRSGPARTERPSPNLLDTVYLCQSRQIWYQEFAISVGESPKPFVGSMTTNEPVERAAHLIRETLGF